MTTKLDEAAVANPANEAGVTTDSKRPNPANDADEVTTDSTPSRSSRSPSASARLPFHELIEAGLRGDSPAHILRLAFES